MLGNSQTKPGKHVCCCCPVCQCSVNWWDFFQKTRQIFLNKGVDFLKNNTNVLHFPKSLSIKFLFCPYLDYFHNSWCLSAVFFIFLEGVLGFCAWAWTTLCIEETPCPWDYTTGTVQCMSSLSSTHTYTRISHSLYVVPVKRHMHSHLPSPLWTPYSWFALCICFCHKHLTHTCSEEPLSHTPPPVLCDL